MFVCECVVVSHHVWFLCLCSMAVQIERNRAWFGEDGHLVRAADPVKHVPLRAIAAFDRPGTL
jgi:hypothetical protein